MVAPPPVHPVADVRAFVRADALDSAPPILLIAAIVDSQGGPAVQGFALSARRAGRWGGDARQASDSWQDFWKRGDPDVE
jgi:hypothetical protein